jgi:hypothetical protein
MHLTTHAGGSDIYRYIYIYIYIYIDIDIYIYMAREAVVTHLEGLECVGLHGALEAGVGRGAPAHD